MKIFIALLRGINVSGQKLIRMAELRESLTKYGLQDVKTYIQSGNVIFRSTLSAKVLEKRIHDSIQADFGFDIPILVREPHHIRTVIDSCPFDQAKKEKSYFTLLSKHPSQGDMESLAELNYPGEEIVLTPKCIYYYCATGIGKAKFTNNIVERKLKVRATTRNFKTMQKLLSLSQDLEK